MPEIIPRIGSENDVELTIQGSVAIDAVAPMTPEDAAYLAKGLLACAASLSAPSKPNAFALISDAQLPVLRWKTAISTLSGKPLLIFLIPPKIELTFELTSKGAVELGKALTSFEEVQQRPGGRSGTIH